MSLKKISVEGRFARFETGGDVEPVLDRNKVLQGMEQTNTDGLFHYATVPPEIMTLWLNEEDARGNHIRWLSQEFYELLDKKLKDPDWAHLLVGGPRHRVGYGH